MNHQSQNNLFLRGDLGEAEGCGPRELNQRFLSVLRSPLVSPVANFTFSNIKNSAVKTSNAKISLRRESDEKKRRKVRFAGLFSRETV